MDTSSDIDISNANLSLDPAIENLINGLVETKLKDSECNHQEQALVWKQQEEEMLKWEELMRLAMEELNAKLAVAERMSPPAENRPQIRRNIDQDSPMVDVTGSSAAIEPGTEVIHSTASTVPKKRCCTAPSSPPVSTCVTCSVSHQENLNTTAIEAPPLHITRSVSRRGSLNIVATTTATATAKAPGKSRQKAPPPSVKTATTATVVKAPPVTRAPPVNDTLRAGVRIPELASPTPPEKAETQPHPQTAKVKKNVKAFNLHIHILWGLIDVKAIPQDPPSQLLSTFNACFSNKAQLHASQEYGPELIPRHLVQIGTAMAKKSGAIGRQACAVEHLMLGYIQACLAKFGLIRWWPDLRQSAYSLYNATCRIIALNTFQQSLVASVYIHLGPNAAYTSDTILLIQMYDHFVFHYMGQRYLKDERTPESVLQELQLSPQYKARIRLAEARLNFLKENNYPKRYRDLIDPKATSDDEFDPSTRVWLIKRRPKRSAKAEKFFRILDAKRKHSVMQDRSRKWREHNRVVPIGNQQDSVFQVLPDKMPIDYFDPDFFNDLQPKTHNRTAVCKVALLPDVTQSFTTSEEEKMSDQAFTKKYGPQLFPLYKMVSNNDMRIIEEEAEEESSAENTDDWIDDNSGEETIEEATENEDADSEEFSSDMSFSDDTVPINTNANDASSTNIIPNSVPSNSARANDTDEINNGGEIHLTWENSSVLT